MAEYTFASSAVRGLLFLAQKGGLDAAKALASAGLTMEDLADVDGVVTQEQGAKIARAIEAGISKEAFFESLMKLSPGEFGLQWYAIRHSKNIAEALSLRARYTRLNNRGMDSFWTTSREGGKISISYTHPIDEVLGRVALESWLLLTIAALNTGYPRSWVPLGGGLATPRPIYAAELERLAGCPLRFSTPDTFLNIPSSALSLSMEGADALLHGVVVAYCESMLSKLTPTSTFTERVRKLLVPLLQHGVPAIEDVSKRLGMSARTVQRRLADESSAFRELVESTQRELAILYLKQRYVTLNEISYLLGFSTHATFHRAFRRWTGETPGEFRRRHLTMPQGYSGGGNGSTPSGPL